MYKLVHRVPLHLSFTSPLYLFLSKRVLCLFAPLLAHHCIFRPRWRLLTHMFGHSMSSFDLFLFLSLYRKFEGDIIHSCDHREIAGGQRYLKFYSKKHAPCYAAGEGDCVTNFHATNFLHRVRIIIYNLAKLEC